MHYGGRSLPIETNNSGASNSRRFHHGSSSSSSDDSTVAKNSGERTAGNRASPSLEDSRSDHSSSSARKQPNKSISSFTVENILMGRQRSYSSSDSPTTTMSESFSVTPPPSSSTSISVSTMSSSGGSSSNHSSVVGTNWVSHPPVKYTKFTMLSPTSMADETQKKKKTDSMIEVQWRDLGSQEVAQGSLSSSIDHGRELKRIPSSLRGSMDLPTSFPITQKPKSFSRSSSSGTPSSFFHKINASSSNSQPQQQSFPTQNVLQTTTKVSALPVVQAIPNAPDAKAAVLHQTFPPSGQQVVLLIPSNSTSIAGSVPTIFYANPVLSFSQSGTTTASPAGVTKLTAVAPISTATAVAYNSASSVSPGSDLGRVSPPSSVHKRHTALDEAAQPLHNQSSESPHRPIALKTTTTTQTTATTAAAPESDGKNSDKMKLYLKRTMPKPPKLRFHMTTVMKQPTGNTVMTSLTAQSPQAIITGEAAGAEHGSLAAAALSENEQQHLRSDVAVESTITRSPNVYSNESTPSHKPPPPPPQRVIATAIAPWTTTKQEPDSDDGSPTQRHSPQTNGAVNLTTATGSSTNSSTITTISKNGTIANKKPQTAVLKDSGFHLQLVKQQSGNTGDVNTNSPQPQVQNAAKEQESSSTNSAVQKSGRQNGRQSGPGRGRGRATRSYTRRKRELTFHLYEDPSTAFRAKRHCRDK